MPAAEPPGGADAADGAVRRRRGALRAFSGAALFVRDAGGSGRVAPGTARRVAAFARPFRGRLAVFAVLAVVDALVVAAVPLLLRALVDRGIDQHRGGLVAVLATVAGVLAVADTLLTLTQAVLAARISEGLVCELRERLFAHVQEMSLSFFAETQTGRVLSRVNTDVLGAQTAFTDLLTNAVGNAVLAIVVLVAMATISWPITLAAFVLLPLVALPARLFARQLASVARERMGVSAALTATLAERFTFSGALLTKLMGDPALEAGAFAAQTRRARDLGIRQTGLARFLGAALGVVAAIGTALVYGVGGHLAATGSLRVGSVVALSAYLVRLYAPLSAALGAQVDVATALVAFDRVFEVLDLPVDVVEAPGAAVLPRGAARLEFRDVRFRYPTDGRLTSLTGGQVQRPAGPEVLHGVSFTVEPGRQVAVVGPSGAGKTTVALLAARLFAPVDGQVLLDGVDSRAVTAASVRERVGLVTQDPHLLHASVRENLCYGLAPRPDDELWAALSDACVDGVVRRLPGGLDAVVGDAGSQLSGGEKQRVAIARVLLRAPDLVILDEATAHLDAASEASVQQALSRVLEGRTSLVIAHRLATVRGADEVLVFDEGRVVERGRHEELVAAGGLYADMVGRQSLAATD